MAGPEQQFTEQPFLDQLSGLGWKVVTGNLDEPSVTGRSSFKEVILAGDLRKALKKINLRDGLPWLDDDRVSQALHELQHITSPKLIEANQLGTDLLLNGVVVDGLPDWDQGRQRKIQFIDWEHPENNSFLAINQFRIDCPPGYAKKYIEPDIVLFVNGVPLGVVECKAPNAAEAIATAIDQLRRYSNQRKASGEVEDNEGIEKLFFTNQIVIATRFDEARVGTISAQAHHFLEWKDTAPVPLADVEKGLGKTTLSSQEVLVAGMLRPAHLLDIIRHFTLFQPVGGHTVKVVARYQQFRAVQFAVDRLLHGKTRKQDGEYDRRGGIVWHTQGSGKSLTMVFLGKKMRSTPELRKFKIVVITDRKDLQRQLSATATLTGETVKVGKNVADVKKLLSEKGPGIVFAMIQKYGDHNYSAVDMGVLNTSDAIVVFVDEAHRSHGNGLHAALMKALPEAARIGFTGTPIIMGEKKKTHSIFGAFIDRYTLKQAEADGAVVPILYEGRTAEGAVADGRDLDQVFEDWFHDKSAEELEAIKRKYGTKGHVLEAEKLIEAKARDMLRHYVENILPNGLKAQVVAYSREAAMRYYGAFKSARDELVKEASELSDTEKNLDDEALQQKPRKVRAAVHAWRNLELLKKIDFAPIISPDNNDPGEWAEWTDGDKIETRIGRFIKPLLHKDASKTDPLAFLIVKSMLLTGFDAPIEGVMYLDRPIREAELLQAIARVNRTGHGKSAGIVVDYYGVARHLKEALSAYTDEDIEGALQSFKDEIPKLRDRHDRVVDLFKSRGCDINDQEACVYLLEDEKLRAEFGVKLKLFLDTLDLVLPRAEALPFCKSAKNLGEIYGRARALYREGPNILLGAGIGNKVRKLIDDHIVSLGIDPKIAPVAITDAKFSEHIEKKVSSRAKASEMEHAAKHHIKKHMEEDPVFFKRLSERLTEILEKFGENWDQLALALKGFVDEVHAGRKTDDTGLDPQTQAPFFSILKEERLKDGAVSGADEKWLAGLAVQLVGVLVTEIGVVGFWKNAYAQDVVRGHVVSFLDDNSVVEFERIESVADRLMELAKANHDKLIKMAVPS
jgi:type I restriction enzyme R subunit